jgi:hypothetical protein
MIPRNHPVLLLWHAVPHHAGLQRDFLRALEGGAHMVVGLDVTHATAEEFLIKVHCAAFLARFGVRRVHVPTHQQSSDVPSLYSSWLALVLTQRAAARGSGPGPGPGAGVTVTQCSASGATRGARGFGRNDCFSWPINGEIPWVYRLTLEQLRC